MPASFPCRATLDHWLRVISAIVLLAMLPIVFYFTTEGTWDVLRKPDGPEYASEFFLWQAESMEQGRFDVPPAAIWNECWYAGNACYGYFGTTPSVMRLPFLGDLFHRRHTAATPLFLGCAIMLACWAALRLLRRVASEAAPRGPGNRMLAWCELAGALAVVPGSTMLFLTRPAVYEEACAWAVAFYLLALDRVWAWHRRRRIWQLAVAIVFGVAAANSRPTAAIACVVLGAVVGVLGWLPAAGRRSTLAAAVCLAILPAVSAAGIYRIKFGTPLPDLRMNEQVPEAPHWARVLRANGNRTAGLLFTPTELVAYFRPDTITLSRSWPWADFRFPAKPIRWVPPLPPGGAYVERVASVTATMPLPWMMTLAAAVWLARGAKGAFRNLRGSSPEAVEDGQDWVLAAGALASAFGMIALTVTTVGITNRYLADFYPASVLGVALGYPLLARVTSHHRALGVAAMVACLVLVAWSVVVVLSLTTRLVFM